MFNANEKDKQVEFFSDSSFSSKKLGKRNFNLERIAVSLSYENIFISIIGLTMVLIVCYSLGVERGKHLAQLGNKNIAVEEEQVQKTPQKKTPLPQEIPQKSQAIELAQPQEIAKPSSYIQVATFRTEKYANKEIGRLKDQGYQPYAVRQGKYRVVCVGGYKDQTEATRDLKQLRKLYADCILRYK